MTKVTISFELGSPMFSKELTNRIIDTTIENLKFIGCHNVKHKIEAPKPSLKSSQIYKNKAR